MRRDKYRVRKLKGFWTAQRQRNGRPTGHLYRFESWPDAMWFANYTARIMRSR